MIIIKVNKDLTTDECIEHSKKLEAYLKEKVLILDEKVSELGYNDKIKRDLEFHKFEEDLK